MKKSVNQNIWRQSVLRCALSFALGAVVATPAALATPVMAEQTAQAVTVTGEVVDDLGEPLIGVSVKVKGEKLGVSTDYDGKYTIKAKPGDVLVFAYVGMKDQEVAVGSQKTINVTLSANSKVMDEVVVIGYGTQRKGDVTSAVSSVKAEDFTVGNFNDAGDLVKGKVAGLTITRPSGDPGAGTEISLRGIVSVSGNDDPLILVDGVPGSLSSVPPENIASIDVLKDASAAAIYGTRGAAGVILITTKTGQREQPATATYSGYVSWSTWGKKADFMTPAEIRAGKTSYNDDGYDTDWLKAISRTAFTQNHSFSITGGSATTSYYGNVSYRDAEGVIKKTGNENIAMSFDISHWMLNDMLKVNLNVKADSYKYQNSNASADGELNIYRQAVIRNPTSPIYNPDGSYNEGSLLQYFNPISLLEEQDGEGKSQQLVMTGNITFEPIKGWQTNLMLSTDRAMSRSGNYLTSYHSSSGINGKGSYAGTASLGDSESRNDYLEITSKYYKNFRNVHRFEGLVGYSWSRFNYESASMGNNNFPTDYFKYFNMASGSALQKGNAWMSSYREESTLIGWFGRVSYGYDNRYNILASLRYEGSSKFGDNNKWGAFPSVSLGWNINNEEFMASTRDWLNQLKLRAGFGITGVIPGASYMSLLRYTFEGGNYYRDGEWRKGLKATSNPNPDLKWEKAREYNVGVDFGFFNDRLGGSLDVYHKTTSDMLYDYAVPSPPNLYTTTYANVGRMRNTGVELLIRAIPVQTRDFTWTTSFTLQHNKNKLLSLSNDLYQTDNVMWLTGVGDPVSQYTHKVEVGETFGQIWSLKAVGVNEQNGLFIINNPHNGLNADFYQEMRNDYENWYTYIGNGIPKYTIGWNNNFTYKHFDLALQFNGQFGFKIVNQQRVFYENNAHAYNRLKSAAEPVGGIRPLSSAQSQVVTSYYIEDGDYLKLSNLTLGYNVPLKNKKYVQQIRVYGSVYNVFTITKYKGMDPELSTDNFWTAGVDSRDKYPTIRSYTAGVNVTF